MEVKKGVDKSDVSRYVIRDKFPDKEFTKNDKQQIATKISRQLRLRVEDKRS